MKHLLVLVLAASLLVFGCAGAPPQKNDSMEKPGNGMEKPGDSMQKNDSMPGKNGSMMNGSKNDSMMGNGSTNGSMMEKPVGYVPFTKTAYDKARAEGKVIFLEFYANWCPICASQAPALEAAFAELKNPEVVAFRVNYKDSDTDADEVEMARLFGITYQHTHLILDPEGNVAKRSQESWNKEMIISEVQKVADLNG